MYKMERLLGLLGSLIAIVTLPPKVGTDTELHI